MSTEAVVDTSVIVALITPEEFSEWASKTISKFSYFHIPDLCFYEVANAIKAKVLKKEINNKEAIAAFAEAVKLMNLYAIHGFTEVIADAMALALGLNVTVYDGAYLSLAEKTGAKLITLDKKFAKNLKGTEYNKMVITRTD